MLVENASNPAYAPSAATPGAGHILFVRDQALLAQPFNERQGRITGEPLPVAQDIGTGPNDPQWYLFTASRNGVVAYSPAGPAARRQIATFDRRGAPAGTVGEPAPLTGDLSLAPDGSRVIVTLREETRTDFWMYDTTRGGRVRLTQNAATNWAPVWSRDGSRLAFQSSRNPGGVYARSLGTADARDELILSRVPTAYTPADWSPDGRHLLLVSVAGMAMAVLPNPGAPDSKPIPIAGTSGAITAAFSPDGHWIAYTLSQSDDFQVYVRPFDPSNPAQSAATAGVQVSARGGALPRWRADGREIYYQTPRAVMAVSVATNPTLKLGTPTALFPRPAGVIDFTWDVSPNGSRFFFLTGEPTAPAPFTFLVNWQEALRR